MNSRRNRPLPNGFPSQVPLIGQTGPKGQQVQIGGMTGPNAFPAQLVVTGPGGIDFRIIGGLSKRQYIAAQMLADADAMFLDAPKVSEFVTRSLIVADELLRQTEQPQQPAEANE